MGKLTKDNVYAKLMEFSISTNKLRKDSAFTRKFKDDRNQINKKYENFSQSVKDKYFYSSINNSAKNIYEDGNLNLNMQNIRDFFNQNSYNNDLKEMVLSRFKSSSDYIHHPNSLVNSAAAIKHIQQVIDSNNGEIPLKKNSYTPVSSKKQKLK